MSQCVPNEQAMLSFICADVDNPGWRQSCKANTCKQLQDIVDVYQLLDVHSGVCLLSMHRSPQGHANEQCHAIWASSFATHCQDMSPQLPRTSSTSPLFQLNPGFATPQLDDMTQMLKLPRYLPFQRELEHQRPLPRKRPKTIL